MDFDQLDLEPEMFLNLKLSFVEHNSAANVLQWHPLKLLKFDNFT